MIEEAEDKSEPQTQAWRRWLKVALATPAAILVGLYSFVVLVNPFSSGRFSPVKAIDHVTPADRLGRISVIRDTRFDGGIFGSSIAYNLDPVRVAAGTGWRIAQIAVQGTTPANHLTLARAFNRLRDRGPSL